MKPIKEFQTTLLVFLIRTIGRLSDGIDMSFKYGFTSGLMLDYIYENKAHGKFLVGKIIDRIFLNNVGWKAVRQRKDNLKKYLRACIEENRKQNIDTVILDIASGPASYLIELLREQDQKGIYAICQDIDLRWLKIGEEKAKRFGLKNVQFIKNDAFDLDALLAIRPKPNVIVSSGFYDWIVDDELVKKSLLCIYKVLPLGGKIIFTNQVAHKQLDLVSKAFVDFNKQPLRMKTRSLELINSWTREVGFKNLESLVDKWGLYSVTKAEK